MSEPGDVIEAVAAAIRAVVADRSKKGRPWSALPEKLREWYRDEARAAIEAYKLANGGG